jgi:hypothetical protein
MFCVGRKWEYPLDFPCAVVSPFLPSRDTTLERMNGQITATGQEFTR